MKARLTKLTALSLFIFAAQAQVKKDAAHEIVSTAHSAPPDIAADAIVTALSRAGSFTPKERTEFLTEAFQLAGSAQAPFSMKPLPSQAVDSSQGAVAASQASARIDTLSLRCRIVEECLRGDARLAVELFREIELPRELSPDDCSASVPDLTRYYALATRLYLNAFSPDQRKKGEDREFADGILANVTSLGLGNAFDFVRQIPPFARGALAARMDLMREDRFAITLTSLSFETRHAFYALIAAAPRDRESFKVLLRAWDDHIVRISAEAQCWRQPRGPGVTQGIAAMTPKAAVAKAADELNQYIILAAEGPAPLLAIDKGRLSDPHQEDMPTPKAYWDSEAGHAILYGAKHLRFGDGMKALSADDRSSADWRLEFASMIRQIEEWKPGDSDSPADVFSGKCSSLESLLVLANGLPQERDLRNLVRDAYLQIVGEASAGDTVPRSLWLVFLRGIVSDDELGKDPKVISWAYSSPAILLQFQVAGLH